MPVELTTTAGYDPALLPAGPCGAPDAVVAALSGVPASGARGEVGGGVGGGGEVEVSVTADCERALTVLARLEPLLASDDTAAGDLFEANRSLLLARFGAGAMPLGRQVMDFDYPAALVTLRKLMRQAP
ncbi:MAG: hypothetical protein IPJ48_01115 [Propionivibrio sp.]|uniref:Uncharacterized protein n=1 Tax=Candidatus Propionivibrio dominans TaxID=2954373 RepID=A0A9D7FBJ4_9RHOO|nr:hypothetical protein [Candidatus Propionivibrio dominans]